MTARCEGFFLGGGGGKKILASILLSTLILVWILLGPKKWDTDVCKARAHVVIALNPFWVFVRLQNEGFFGVFIYFPIRTSPSLEIRSSLPLGGEGGGSEVGRRRF